MVSLENQNNTLLIEIRRLVKAESIKIGAESLVQTQSQQRDTYEKIIKNMKGTIRRVTTQLQDSQS